MWSPGGAIRHRGRRRSAWVLAAGLAVGVASCATHVATPNASGHASTTAETTPPTDKSGEPSAEGTATREACATDLQTLKAAVANFEVLEGHEPSSVAEVVSAGQLSEPSKLYAVTASPDGSTAVYSRTALGQKGGCPPP